MSVPCPLSAETQRRLDIIIDQELIGGQQPSVGLNDIVDDESTLCDSEFMAVYFNSELTRRGSTLRVKPMERYWFEEDLLGASSDLGLIDEAQPDAPMRLFYFGRYNPAVIWHPIATGQRLERRRQWYFDNVEQTRLREAAEAQLINLALRVETIVRGRMARTRPNAEQDRHLKSILPYNESLKRLDSWVYVCQIMSYNFTDILVEACQTAV